MKGLPRLDHSLNYPKHRRPKRSRLNVIIENWTNTSRLRGLAPRRDEGLDLITEPPFSMHIIAKPRSRYFKMPQLEIYNGSTDLVNYLESFKMLMLLHGATERILFWAFPSTLRKTTQYKYSSLKPGSIHSFDQ